MEPVLLYGVPEGCSFGSIVALEWAARPYRLARVDMLGEAMSTDLYARFNPVRETPALVTEGGATLTESVAILLHIAALGRGRGPGFGPGTREYDRLTRELSFLNSSYFSAFRPLWSALEMRDADPQTTAVLRAYGRDQVAHRHAQLEASLGGGDWLLGAEKSIADAYFAGLVRWGDFHRVVDWAEYPRLKALRDRLEDDPAVRFAHAIEAGRPATSSGGFLGHVELDDLARRLAA